MRTGDKSPWVLLRRDGQTRRRALLLTATASLLATTAFGTMSARAVDGTWVGGNAGDPNEWTEGANWSSNVAPDGTATFTNNGAPTSVQASGVVDLSAITFTASPNNAPAYTISMQDAFIVTGAGVSNNSTSTQTFDLTSISLFENSASASGGTAAVTYVNTANMLLFNTSTAGTAIITNNSDLEFNDSSNAGTAQITNNATLNFNGNSSASSATIINASGQVVNFFNSSSAGTATINNSGTLNFNNTSTASSATITGATGSATTFNNSATAGSSTITLQGTATLAFNNSSTAGSATINSALVGGSITFNDTSTAGSANIVLKQASLIFNNSASAGSAVITMPDPTHPGTITFNNTSTAASSNITVIGSLGVGGSLNFLNASTAANAIIVNNNGGTTTFGVAIVGTDTATAGNATITNNAGGTTEFVAATTAGSATITNKVGGFVQFGDSGAGASTATAGNSIIGNSGTVSFNALTTAGNATITTNSGGNVFFFDSSTGGSAAFVTNTGGTFDMSGLTASGMTAGSIAGAGSYVLGSKQLTVGSNNASTVVSGVLSGIGGSLVKVGTGTLTLDGIDTYTGATIVNGGTLIVNGSITNTSSTTVNAGGTLTVNGTLNDPTVNAGGTLNGVGSVGATQINAGGTLAPGNGTPGTSLTINGSLALASGAIYMVQVNPTTASLTNVNGATTISGGTVNAIFAPGGYITKQYDILHATSVSGTFASLTTTGAPPGLFKLDYTTTDVFLDFIAKVGAGTPLNVNQQNVANGINAVLNSGGAVPVNFLPLFGFTGTTLQTALSQLDGQDTTGASKSAFQFMSDFLNLMLDPASGGGGFGGGSGGSDATGFAPEQDSMLPSEIVSAYNKMLTKAPPKQTFDQRWTAWGAAFGGTSHTDGDPAIGSTNVNASDYGFAGGMTYHLSPQTLFGFAIAGGGTNWSLDQNLGTGRSDAFQAGVYAKTHSGPAYLSGALAFANHWFTTNRTSALGDQLQGKFQGQSYGGRLEAGYRYGLPSASDLIGFTPYAAMQVQSFHTAAFSEADLTAGGFGLNFAAMNATDARSELGARFDDLTMLGAMPLILRGRLAWAHDWVSNPALGAVFQTLPGSNFIVNGAAPPKNSALTTASAELRMTENWSLLGKFDGEFGKGAQTYGGTGTLRYLW